MRNTRLGKTQEIKMSKEEMSATKKSNYLDIQDVRTVIKYGKD